MSFYTPRVRVIDSRFPTDETVTSVSPTGIRTVTPYKPSFTGTLKTMSDSNNRGWRKAQANGRLTMTDCVMTRLSRTYSPGSIFIRWANNATDTTAGDLIWMCENHASSIPNLNPGSNMEAIALANAYAKMNASPLMLAEQLNDLGQTVGMLRSPFKTARQLVMKMTKYRNARLGKTAKSAAKASADAWLEYRYGWKPLILDAETIIKESHKFRARCDRIHLVARAQENHTSNVSGTWPATYFPASSWASAGSISRNLTVRCSAGVIYDVKSRNTIEDLNTLLGTRLRDVPATLWEILPYSFVVDWFVNVGSWLQAVTPVPGLEVQSRWHTRVEEEVVTTSATFAYPPPAPTTNVYSGSFGSSVINRTTFKRTANPETTATPVLTNRSLSVLHQVDAVSLMVQPILGGLKGLRH